jgi:hypothetical protein
MGARGADTVLQPRHLAARPVRLPLLCLRERERERESADASCSEWKGMRTVYQLRQDNQIPLKPNADSEYTVCHPLTLSQSLSLAVMYFGHICQSTESL